MLANGRHTLGPETGTLQVRTSREGAYARAGHDLVMEVERWEGVLDVNDDEVSLEITCDARSLRVRWGFNGTTSLSDKDRADIGTTIDTKVLRGAAIRFRSTGVRRVAEKLRIAGDLTIGTTTRRIEFDLRTNDDGTRADATASVRQTSFGIKPYSAMLATLKVGDDVEITARATLPRWTPPVVAEPQRDEVVKFVEPVAEVESIEPRQPAFAAHSEPTAATESLVPVGHAEPVPPAREIEPWQPVARHYFAPKPAADQHAPVGPAAPRPAVNAIEPWQPAAPQYPAPTPVADAIELAVPAEHTASAPAADAIEQPEPVEHATSTPAADGIEQPGPVEHTAPTPAADAIEQPEPAEHTAPTPAADAIEQPMPVAHATADAIQPLEYLARTEHATPTPAADAIEPRQPVLAEDPAAALAADAIEPRRPTPPPQVAQPREARRLGFFGPVRFR